MTDDSQKGFSQVQLEKLLNDQNRIQKGDTNKVTAQKQKDVKS